MQCILIVDDNKENQGALAAVLNQPDIEILASSNGHEALRLLLKHDVALALIDVQMPVMGGFEMAELMRRTKKTSVIPIMFLSDTDDKREQMRGYSLGAVDHLARPLANEVLRAKVKIFLDIDRQKRELARRLKEARRLTDQNEQLLQSLGDGIISVDASGVIGFSNPAVNSLFGVDPATLNGRHVGEFLFQNKDAYHAPWASFDIHKMTRRGERLLSTNGYYFMTPGGLRPAEISAAPVSSSDGDYAGAVITLRACEPTARSVSLADIEKKNRRHTRRRVGVILRVFERKTGMNIGRLVNISQEGLKVSGKEALAVGRRYELGMILPEPLEGSNTLKFDARVVWSRPAADAAEGYHAGFQLINIEKNDSRILAQFIERY